MVRDGDEEADKLHPLIQTANDLAVHALVQAGYDGKLLRAKICEDKHNGAEKSITEPNTAARVAALVNAKTHGSRFHATHGTHSTSDDIMKHGAGRTYGSSREASEGEETLSTSATIG